LTQNGHLIIIAGEDFFLQAAVLFAPESLSVFTGIYTSKITVHTAFRTICNFTLQQDLEKIKIGDFAVRRKLLESLGGTL
jgi:hypothetical protein